METFEINVKYQIESILWSEKSCTKEVSCGLNVAYAAVLTPTDGRTCRGAGER